MCKYVESIKRNKPRTNLESSHFLGRQNVRARVSKKDASIYITSMLEERSSKQKVYLRLAVRWV